MQITVAPKSPGFHGAGRLDRDPQLWRRHFMDIILADERVRGEVLDAGCGTVGPSNEDTQRIYDAARAFGVHTRSFAQQFLFKIEKSGVLPERVQPVSNDHPIEVMT